MLIGASAICASNQAREPQYHREPRSSRIPGPHPLARGAIVDVGLHPWRHEAQSSFRGGTLHPCAHCGPTGIELRVSSRRRGTYHLLRLRRVEPRTGMARPGPLRYTRYAPGHSMRLPGSRPLRDGNALHSGRPMPAARLRTRVFGRKDLLQNRLQMRGRQSMHPHGKRRLRRKRVLPARHPVYGGPVVPAPHIRTGLFGWKDLQSRLAVHQGLQLPGGQ